MLQTGATSSILETQITPTAVDEYAAPIRARSYPIPSLAPDLLAVTPPLNEHFDEMREAVADRRVIIVRQGGTISVGTLVAIFASLAAHAALAVLVFFLWKVIIAAPWAWGQGQTSAMKLKNGRLVPASALPLRWAMAILRALIPIQIWAQWLRPRHLKHLRQSPHQH